VNKVSGVIYIMINRSFPDYVKIGYASDVRERLKQLNRSECIPFAFSVYATYEVPEPLLDKELHALIDRLNPDLRTKDKVDGKLRVREFYVMSAEDAYALLESIAIISGTSARLRRWLQEDHEISDASNATEIQETANERRDPFCFSKCGILPGSIISLINHPEIKFLPLNPLVTDQYYIVWKKNVPLRKIAEVFLAELKKGIMA